MEVDQADLGSPALHSPVTAYQQCPARGFLPFCVHADVVFSLLVIVYVMSIHVF